MAVSIPHTGTEYVFNALTVTRGNLTDVTYVGVYHTSNPAEIPELTDFAEVELDGTDIRSKVGPRNGITLAPGDYQRWVRVSTSDEDILRRPDTITIL